MRPDILVEQNTEQQEQEEAIVPVKPSLRGVRPNAPVESPGRTGGPLLLGAVLVTLLAVAVVVIFFLPGWVADRQSEQPEEPEPVSAAAPELVENRPRHRSHLFLLMPRSQSKTRCNHNKVSLKRTGA